MKRRNKRNQKRATSGRRQANGTSGRRQANGTPHSTTVLHRKRAVMDLAAALAAQGDTVTASLEERLATVLEKGEEMPDVRHFFRLLERLVERSGDDLDEADGDRFVRAMRLKVLQEQTRETKAKLHDEVVKVRKTLVDLYGSARVRFQFGLAERTPRGTADLADEARRLAVRLADPELSLPEPAAGLEPDPEGWARSLRPPMVRLDRLLKELERRRIGAGDGVLEQRRALAACDQTCLLVARTAEALFRLAGEKELARRLRPKANRRRRRRRSGVVQAVVNGWSAVVAAWQQLRGLVARSAEAVRNWADLRKPAAFRLARGSLKTPDV